MLKLEEHDHVPLSGCFNYGIYVPTYTFLKATVLLYKKDLI